MDTESKPLESPSGIEELKQKIVEVLKTIYDPEIPVNIYAIGLIYEVKVDVDNVVSIDMTLTSPACPVAGTLPGDVESKVAAISGVASAKVNLVWEPTWTPEKMSEAAQLQLGML